MQQHPCAAVAEGSGQMGAAAAAAAWTNHTGNMLGQCKCLCLVKLAVMSTTATMHTVLQERPAAYCATVSSVWAVYSPDLSGDTIHRSHCGFSCTDMSKRRHALPAVAQASSPEPVAESASFPASFSSEFFQTTGQSQQSPQTHSKATPHQSLLLP